MMFTMDQGRELVNNTTYEWTSINGVNGGKFINKTDSSKYIFFPAGGYSDENTFAGMTYSSNGWGTTIWKHNSYQEACNLLVASAVGGMSDGSDRYYGFFIRPVRPWTW